MTINFGNLFYRTRIQKIFMPHDLHEDVEKQILKEMNKLLDSRPELKDMGDYGMEYDVENKKSTIHLAKVEHVQQMKEIVNQQSMNIVNLYSFTQLFVFGGRKRKPSVQEK